MIEVPNVVVVVAHPDDEIIWFSSLLDQCKSVVVCFGPSATSKKSWDNGRTVLMDSYPLAKVKFLKIRQSDAFEAANWDNPKETDSGLHLRPRRIRTLYERNADELLRLLETELQRESVVFTHNPWGEYGHAEHVQVFRVLSKLKEKLGFGLFVDGYVSKTTLNLMSQHAHTLRDEPLVRSTDRSLAHRLKDLYINHECWTWVADYEWPEREIFYRISQPSDQQIKSVPSTSISLNYITKDNVNRSFLRQTVRKALPSSVRSAIKRARHLD
jgi:LmbE family N-acetylglucosaminyl deacetylase